MMLEGRHHRTIDGVKSLTATARRWAVPLQWATAAGFVLSFAIHEALIPHVILGCIFTVASIGHVLAYTRWIRTVSRRIGRGVLPRKVVIDAVIDAAMAVLVALIATTGFAAMIISPSNTAEDDSNGIGELHLCAAFALLILIIAHVVRHLKRPAGRSKRSRKANQRPGSQPEPSIRASTRAHD